MIIIPKKIYDHCNYLEFNTVFSVVIYYLLVTLLKNGFQFQ